VDSGGYTTIAEDLTYGDFLTGVTSTNASMIQQLSGGGVLAITVPPTCPNGYQNSTYTGCYPFASGGTPPYAWDLSAGSLCTGLSQNGTTGAITGTPTVHQSCDFTVRVTDSVAATATKRYQPTIFYPVLTITTTLPAGSLGVFYTAPQTYTGGNGTNAWLKISGSLPPGLALNASTGAITGIPTATGTYGFTVQATDTETPPQVATHPESITIPGGGGLTITTTSTPMGFQLSPYGPLTITATGGTPPYKFHLVGFYGFCPTGLAATGFDVYGATPIIAGTPTAHGSCIFTATVIDSHVPANFAGQPLTILIEYPVLSISPPLCPVGAVGRSYFCPLVTIGGNGTNTWVITLGALPDGLVLNSNTGIIAGVPGTAGVFTANAQVTDSETPPQVATGTVNITINAINGVGTKLTGSVRVAGSVVVK
jgi:hypothetical protein